jgi:hypothetical protein
MSTVAFLFSSQRVYRSDPYILFHWLYGASTYSKHVSKANESYAAANTSYFPLKVMEIMRLLPVISRSCCGQRRAKWDFVGLN